MGALALNVAMSMANPVITVLPRFTKPTTRYWHYSHCLADLQGEWWCRVSSKPFPLLFIFGVNFQSCVNTQLPPLRVRP